MGMTRSGLGSFGTGIGPHAGHPSDTPAEQVA